MNRTVPLWVILIGLLLNKASFAEKFAVVGNSIRIQTKARLLNQVPVQRDLQLTDEQRKAISKIVHTEIRSKLEVLEQRLAEYSQNALSASQLARLDEIYVQTRGAESLLDSTIATKLGISDDQKAKLDVARKKYVEEHGEWGKLFQDGPFNDVEEVKAWVKAKNDARQAVMARFDDAAMSILKPEQLDQLTKLRGKPIDFGRLGSTDQRFWLRPEVQSQ
jgi:Spy/CpxP family protein refolding chaperone